ncbi:MAG: hypothetical protein KC776_24430 [Myxococcales bacterium]|nr:hypothetical protein [Myxococcales bacterium]MCB9582890.1 hypothetical protein [Polyangiaceae bacterium]
MRFAQLFSLASAFALLACSSSGGGGGAASCADGGTCPSGQVCGSNGVCVSQGTGGGGGFGNSGGTGGGSGGSGGGSSAICGQSCDSLAAANCPADPGHAACVSQCEAQRQGAPQCIAQYDAFLGCLLGGQATCDTNGTPTVNVTPGLCDAQNQAYNTCVSGSGGSGGIGGGSGGIGGGSGGIGGSTGGFGGTGATGGSGGTTNGCQNDYFGKNCFDLTTGNATCDSCAQESCCTDLNTCLQDTVCAQAVYCFMNFCVGSSDPIGCLTTTCAACSGSAQGITTLSCLQSSCTSVCPF